jgi:hypothetical protein
MVLTTPRIPLRVEFARERVSTPISVGAATAERE